MKMSIIHGLINIDILTLIATSEQLYKKIFWTMSIIFKVKIPFPESKFLTYFGTGIKVQ